MRVYEGSIITCDSQGSIQNYLVEDKGKIVFCGSVLPKEYNPYPKTILGEKALCPAFADTHIHFASHALFSGGLDIRGAKSLEEAQKLIADFAAKRRDKILIGFGSSANSVMEKRLLERKDLDQVCPKRPVFIVKYDGHAAIINRALIDLLPETAKQQRGFNAESGLMTQEAFFRVTDFVTASISLPKTLSNMLKTIDSMAEKGIGLVHSVSGVGFPGDLDVSLEGIFAKGLKNELPYRIFFQTMEVKKVLKRKLPRIGGCFITALDGCYGSEDAALLMPYSNNPENSGVLYYSNDKVIAFAKEANRAGLQIEVHAIGDRAFKQAVTALSEALKDFPRKDHRHTIIHACLPTEEGLKTCADLGIAIALQPAFLQWEQEPLEYLEAIMGDRVYKISPLRQQQDMGILMTGGSDAPCTSPDPIEGIWAACNHYVPEQSLNLQEALNLYTRNAAYLCFDEKERGSLEAGKKADFVILNKNPFSIDKTKLREVQVKQLFLSGKAYKSGQGSLSLLLRSLISRRKI